MAVEFEQSGSVAIFVLDNPPVNALSAAVRAELTALFESTLARPDIKRHRLAAKGRHFSAGADMREFRAPPRPDAPQLPHLIERLEQSPLPVVAALSGTVAGGATELALGCHYRVAANDLAMSLPEVTLGFIPGAGGTQRLPRLAGLSLALDLILSGRAIGASEAAGAGIVDLVAGRDELRARAVAFAPQRRCSADAAHRRAPGAGGGRRDVGAGRGETAARGARPARAAGGARVHRGDARDAVRGGLAARSARCSRSCRRAGSRGRCATCSSPSAKRAEGGGHRSASAPVRPIRTAGVVGFGTMGSGIAMAFANAGIPVRMLDARRGRCERGLRDHPQDLRRRPRQGADDSAAETDARRAGGRGRRRTTRSPTPTSWWRRCSRRWTSSTTCSAGWRGLPPGRDPRHQHLEPRRQRDRGGHAHPDRVLGLHFFSPAQVMRLVEVVRPPAVDVEVLATAMALVKRLGKLGVVVGVCDGFAGNRMLVRVSPPGRLPGRGGRLAAAGGQRAARLRHAMGPFRTSDMVGLDVSWRIRRRAGGDRRPSFRYSPIADRLCELGRFGQKTGAGWYRYETGSREAACPTRGGRAHRRGERRARHRAPRGARR